MLLDLLGMPDPKFYSYFSNTEKEYSRFVENEQRAEAFMVKYGNSGITNRYTKGYFQSQALPSNIEDDHIPFLHRGVPILHLIPVPFPTEWHTLKDDWHAVDLTTTENLNCLIRIFVAEYLHLKL